MPSTGGDHASALSRARVERCPAGRRGFAAARDHRCSVTSTRPLAAPFSRVARGRVRSCGFCRNHVSTSTTTDRSSIPAAGVGDRDDCQSRKRVSPIEGSRRMGSRSGAEEHRSSALPAVIAHHGDFAPTSLRSGRLLSRWSPLALSGETRGEGDTAFARREGRTPLRACKATPARGSCDTAPPRRGPMLTNPRHLPPRGRSRTNGGRLWPAELTRSWHQRLFHRPETAQGNACLDPDGSTDRRG